MLFYCKVVLLHISSPPEICSFSQGMLERTAGPAGKKQKFDLRNVFLYNGIKFQKGESKYEKTACVIFGCGIVPEPLCL